MRRFPAAGQAGGAAAMMLGDQPESTTATSEADDNEAVLLIQDAALLELTTAPDPWTAPEQANLVDQKVADPEEEPLELELAPVV